MTIAEALEILRESHNFGTPFEEVERRLNEMVRIAALSPGDGTQFTVDISECAVSPLVERAILAYRGDLRRVLWRRCGGCQQDMMMRYHRGEMGRIGPMTLDLDAPGKLYLVCQRCLTAYGPMAIEEEEYERDSVLP